ncbi:Amino-acid acetyltransferase [uncultured archaeon]|nr:Amino-acid acetyltransferase [uncultured archaeon]
MLMIRKAAIGDVEAIKSIINAHAKKGLMLPRATYEVYETIRDFYVAQENRKVIGCCAIHIYGREYKDNTITEHVLGELRSLAVLPANQGNDVGTELVEYAISDVKSIGITKVFTLTYVKDFFKKMKFWEIKRHELPQKIWSDCKGCIKFPDECDETAMVREI